MQAITVTFKGPSARLPARVVAHCSAGKGAYVVNDSNPDEAALRAVRDLVLQLGWENYGDWVGGDTSGDTRVFVCVHPSEHLALCIGDTANEVIS